MIPSTYQDHKNLLIIAITGLVLWIAGAAYFGVSGEALTQGPLWFFLFNTGVATLAWGMMFRALVRLRKVRRRLWMAAAIAFAAPGLLLEVLVLVNIDSLFTESAPETLGRYAGLIAFAFLMLPAFAWPRPASANRGARSAR